MQDLLTQFQATVAPRKVGIVEFAESPLFCGRRLYPKQRLLLKLIFLEDLTDEEELLLDGWERGGRDGQEIKISPFMRERVQHLKDNGYPHFREVVLVGGRRSSKGFITALALAKKVFDLVQLQDPTGYYGIDAGKPIMFSCIAAAQQQAKEAQYSDLAGMVNTCAWLNKNNHVGKMQELEFSVLTESDKRQLAQWKRQGRQVLKDTSTIRGNALPANARTIRGNATIAYVFDEFGHFMQGDSDQSDTEVYAAAEPSLKQFGRASIIFCNSSPYAKTGKFYQRFEEAMTTDNGGPLSHQMFTLQFPSWGLYEGWWADKTYRGARKCQAASPDWDPERLNEDGTKFHTMDDQQSILSERNLERSDPMKYKVEARGKWSEVIDAYLNPAAVDRMYYGRPNPDGLTYTPLKINKQDSTYQYTYRAHLDPSSTTAGFGFALAHVEELTIQGRVEQHVIFDIVQRWNPRDFPDEVIDWEVVIREVMIIADIFRPTEITMDQHNCLSASSLLQTGLGLTPLRELVNPDGVMRVGDIRSIAIPVQGKDSTAIATKAYYRGEADTRILQTKQGYSIEITPEHRMWTRRAKIKPWHRHADWGWRRAEEIGVGDWISVRRSPEVFPSEWVKLEPRNKSRWAFRARHKHFPTQVTPELGAILGWLSAEGYITSDAWSVDNCCPEATREFGVNLAKVFGGEWCSTKRAFDGEWSDQYKMSGCGSLAKFFDDLGVGGTSQQKTVPPVIMRSPPDVIVAYLRWLFEGDGGVQIARSNDEVVRLTTTSAQLATEVQQLLCSLGIFSHHWRGKYVYEGEVRDVSLVKMFGLDIVDYHAKIGFVSSRKNELLERAVQRISERDAGRRYKQCRGEHELWLQISEITESRNECYDIEVPGQESFVANGIITHNSKYPIQTIQRELRNRGIGEVHVFEKTANLQANWNRAEVFRTALYRNLIHAPAYDVAFPDIHHSAEELKYLQEMRNARVPRIEKQDSGPVTTKDIADCMMEVVEALIGNVIAKEVRGEIASGLQVGAPGGYAIGLHERGRGPLTDANGERVYAPRFGEQSFYGARRVKPKASPTRRPIGGGPIPRRLPGW